MRNNFYKLLLVGSLASMAGVTHSNDLTAGTSKTISIHQSDKQSQQRIDAADIAIKEAVDEYLSNEHISDVTEAYNRQVSALISSQEQEIVDLQAQIDSLEETDRAVLPMLNRMLETLAKFVEKDTPFLLSERAERVERLRKLLLRADVSVAEKYRQLLEAYSVEVQYGRTFEAYRGAVQANGLQQVTFLRLGRSALYYQSLDGLQSYLWQQSVQSWEMLGDSQNLVVTKAIQVAQQQKVPTLLNLPLPEMER